MIISGNIHNIVISEAIICKAAWDPGCISTCYRVGTVEVENHVEIDNYLKKIAKIKNISKHVLLGDFNLNKTVWPEGVSSSKLEGKFLNTFQDIGFSQLINVPTHDEGRTLDLLLSNSPNFVSDINVLEQNQVCNSDHFAITFSIELSPKRTKSTKRRIYNYKKATWALQFFK